MTSRVVAIALLVIGAVAIAAGLGLRIFLTDDDGHHDGRSPTFALSSVEGADELIVAVEDDGVVTVRIERAGQQLIDFNDVHDAPVHAYAVADDGSWYAHVDPPLQADGTIAPFELPAGPARLVVHTSPGGGPDLQELGIDIDVPSAGAELPPGSTDNIATDDEWTDGSLTVRRQGFDFVLSEPWNGDDYQGGPALLAMFRLEDGAFVHEHAEVLDDDTRFRFAAELPGRGEYIGAVEFEQNGELVTAVFRFDV
ncbi:MAG: hypothetical protein AAFY28_05040 [Actinomycetota bacterium]